MANEGTVKKADRAYAYITGGSYAPTFNGLTVNDAAGGGTKIYAPGTQLSLYESDNSDKRWNISVNNGDFLIVENGVSTGLAIMDGSVVWTDRRIVGYENVSVGTDTVGTDGHHVLTVANGTAPSAHVDNAVQVYSTDSSDATATLGLYLEQAVEDIGTFTASHKIKIFINGTAYWLSLDAV